MGQCRDNSRMLSDSTQEARGNASVDSFRLLAGGNASVDSFQLF